MYAQSVFEQYARYKARGRIPRFIIFCDKGVYAQHR